MYGTTYWVIRQDLVWPINPLQSRKWQRSIIRGFWIHNPFPSITTNTEDHVKLLLIFGKAGCLVQIQETIANNRIKVFCLLNMNLIVLDQIIATQNMTSASQNLNVTVSEIFCTILVNLGGLRCIIFESWQFFRLVLIKIVCTQRKKVTPPWWELMKSKIMNCPFYPRHKGLHEYKF